MAAYPETLANTGISAKRELRGLYCYLVCPLTPLMVRSIHGTYAEILT